MELIYDQHDFIRSLPNRLLIEHDEGPNLSRRRRLHSRPICRRLGRCVSLPRRRRRRKDPSSRSTMDELLQDDGRVWTPNHPRQQRTHGQSSQRELVVAHRSPPRHRRQVPRRRRANRHRGNGLQLQRPVAVVRQNAPLSEPRNLSRAFESGSSADGRDRGEEQP